MKRATCAPRADWQKAVEADGLVWHTPYWGEGTYYSLSELDVAAIKAASEALYTMFVAAGAYVVENRLFEQFEIPEYIVPTILKAWEQEPPCLNYGRFDFGYNGDGKPKLFEFNCDTPTSLLEASIVQARWKESVFPKLGQSNEIHEWLEWKWKDIVGYLPPAADVYVSAADDAVGEDVVTATYMAEFIKTAGRNPILIKPGDIGWNEKRRQFVDLDEKAIGVIYKLYPWEWLLREEYGAHVPISETTWIEPVWKSIWSNKAILPVLWKLYPNHPLLLEASFDPLLGENLIEHIVKPIYGREGRGVRLSTEEPRLDDRLGKEIHQARFKIKPYDDKYPVIGSWMVDGNFAGIGIREGGPITGNTSTFVPHVIEAY